MTWSRFPLAAAVLALTLAVAPAESSLPAEVLRDGIMRGEEQSHHWAVYKRRMPHQPWIFHGSYRLHHQAEYVARGLRELGWQTKVEPYNH